MNNENMKNVRFTQNINVCVTVEAQIPEHWDSHVFANAWVTNVVINELDSSKEFVITELTMDSAEITDSTVWTV